MLTQERVELIRRVIDWTKTQTQERASTSRDMLVWALEEELSGAPQADACKSLEDALEFTRVEAASDRELKMLVDIAQEELARLQEAARAR